MSTDMQSTGKYGIAINLAFGADMVPEQWRGDDVHDAQIVYANGVYSVGDNGDVQDFTDWFEAGQALANAWRVEDDNAR